VTALASERASEVSRRFAGSDAALLLLLLSRCRSCSRRVGVVSPPRPSVRSPPRHVMSGAVAQQRKLVEQLRIECSITRMPLSQTIKAIVAYTEQAKENDPFLCGIDKKENPFMEKGGCAIL